MGKRVIISVTNDLSMDQRVDRACQTLVEAGYEVLLVGRRKRSSQPLPERTYATRRMRLLFESGKWFYLEFNFRLFWFLLFRRCHVFWANDMDTLLPNWMVARLRGRRIVYDSHEYWTEVPELINRPGTRRIWLWLERRLFPRVDSAATVNQSIADIYADLYQLPVHVIRNVPLRKPEAPLRDTPGNILIYQGALNVGRGLELMVDAMAFLPEHTLWLVGGGPLEEELRKRVEEKGVGERVKLWGWTHYSKLADITPQASLGMSLEEDRGMSYHLALPNKLFDYIQAGLPVLVADLPEMRRVCESYGVGEVLGKEERGPEQLAGRIRNLMAADTWRKHHQASRSAAAELHWEREQERLLAFLEGRSPDRLN